MGGRAGWGEGGARVGGGGWVGECRVGLLGGREEQGRNMMALLLSSCRCCASQVSWGWRHWGGVRGRAASVRACVFIVCVCAALACVSLCLCVCVCVCVCVCWVIRNCAHSITL